MSWVPVEPGKPSNAADSLFIWRAVLFEFEGKKGAQEGCHEKASDSGMDSSALSRVWGLRKHVSGTGRVRKHHWHGDGPARERSGWSQCYGDLGDEEHHRTDHHKREWKFFGDPPDPGHV